MTRQKLVASSKLSEIPEEEFKIAISTLALHIKSRLAYKTRTGAHSEQNLGMPAVDFYVVESIKKLFEGTWEWKFQQYSLTQQLTRIANSLISETVRKYKHQKEKETELQIVDKDISEIKHLKNIPVESEDGEDEKRIEELVMLAHECSKGNDELGYYTLRYFEGTDVNIIADEMKISLEKVYQLQRKLLRRIVSSINNKNLKK